MEGAAASYDYAPGTDRVSKQLVSGVARYAFGYDRQANLSAMGRYDAAGTSIQSAVCLRHDALGRMVLYGTRSAAGLTPDATVCTSDAEVTSPVARFKYDARNRRIARQEAASGQWTYTISDPSGDPLSELLLVAGAWVKVRDYVWLDGRPLSQIEYPTSTTTYAYYLHLDHIGLPRAMTNQSGQLVWNTFPRPYGDIAEKTTTDPLSGQVVVTNLRLPGQYDQRLLSSVGLQGPYYNWHRWYLPGVGRYIELDPIAFSGGPNGHGAPDWYNYGSDNPQSNIDPWGLFDCHPGETTVVCKCRLDPSTCVLVPPQISPSLPWWLRWLAPAPLPFLGGDDPPPPPRPPDPPKPCDDGDDPKDKCWEGYVKCASGPLGGMRSNQFGYSQCNVCQEQCIQNGGVWPVRASNGKPCL